MALCAGYFSAIKGMLTMQLIVAMQLKCNIINLSYGEATSTPNIGFVPMLSNSLFK